MKPIEEAGTSSKEFFVVPRGRYFDSIFNKLGIMAGIVKKIDKFIKNESCEVNKSREE